MKKIIGLAVILTIVFSLCACGQDVALSEYKAESLAYLDIYLSSEIKNDCTWANWDKIEELIVEGKQEIETSQSIDEIKRIQDEVYYKPFRKS